MDRSLIRDHMTTCFCLLIAGLCLGFGLGVGQRLAAWMWSWM